jgi:hypothetical protein
MPDALYGNAPTGSGGGRAETVATVSAGAPAASSDGDPFNVANLAGVVGGFAAAVGAGVKAAQKNKEDNV